MSRTAGYVSQACTGGVVTLGYIFPASNEPQEETHMITERLVRIFAGSVKSAASPG
jgi:hypothetical protein